MPRNLSPSDVNKFRDRLCDVATVLLSEVGRDGFNMRELAGRPRNDNWRLLATDSGFHRGAHRGHCRRIARHHQRVNRDHGFTTSSGDQRILSNSLIVIG